MTLHPIIESGMTFGPYPEGYCFYIEKSQTYQGIQSGVKMAEFLLLHDPKRSLVWIVEAKSSSPRPKTQPNFDKFIQEICAKLTNAMALCIATCLQRHASTYDELPAPFQSLALEKTDFRLILVINEAEDSWLPPLKDALEKALKPTAQIWKLSPTFVVVMNDKMARKKGLIQ